VTLVDADLRSPSIHGSTETERSPGLSEALLGADLEGSVVHPRHHPELGVLPAGTPVDDPAGLLEVGLGEKLLAFAGADLVIIDTSAHSLYADALAVAIQCDVTLVIVDARSTRRRALGQLVDRLQRASAKPIGVVINRSEPSGRARRGR